MKTAKSILILLLLAIYTHFAGNPVQPGISSALSHAAPDGFIENKGQIIDQDKKPRPDVRFLFIKDGIRVQLRDNGFSYEICSVKPDLSSTARESSLNDRQEVKIHRIDVSLEGSNPAPEIITEGRSPGYFNYYTGYLPCEGVKGIHTFKKIIYKNIYPGIDLVFYANKNQSSGSTGFKYDFVINPGGRTDNIRLAYNGAAGLMIDGDGRLVVKTSIRDICETIPKCYLFDRQPANQIHSEEINAAFRLNENVLSFSASKYDAGHGLVIDPVLSWATYYGGTSQDRAYSISSTGSYIYVSGSTSSIANIATSGAYQQTLSGGDDAFLLQLTSSGERNWCTYYGGSLSDLGLFVCSNSTSVYTGGWTSSPSGIASTGAHQTAIGGNIDGWIAKFNTNGDRQWATYYGGTQDDYVISGALDSKGDLYLAGNSGSNSGIATPGSYQAEIKGNVDCFLAKFNASGVRQWATYFGGNKVELSGNTVIDGTGNIYICGVTNSTSDVATTGVLKDALTGGYDNFIAYFNSSGQRQWATYFGGDGNESNAPYICLDKTGNLIIAGTTNSTTSLSTNGSYQVNYAGGQSDTYIARLRNQRLLAWSTYYGGEGDEYISGICTDNNNNIFITGITNSTGAISSQDVHQSEIAGNYDAFLVKLDSVCSRQWGTYFGGTDDEMVWLRASTFNKGNGLCMDDLHFLYCVGSSASAAGIATDDGVQTYMAGIEDAFVAKFASNYLLTSSAVSSPLCSHGTVNIPFSANFTFEKDNIFTAQLSDAKGSFAKPVNIGTLTGRGSGVINAVIPDLVAAGEGFHVRVMSSNPKTYSKVNPNDITIYQFDKGMIQGETETCEKTQKVYQTLSNIGSANEWSVAGGVIVGRADLDRVTVAWDVPRIGIVKLIQTSMVNGCKDSVSINVNVHPLPAPKITGPVSACNNKIVTYSAEQAENQEYSWSVSGGVIIGQSTENKVDVKWTNEGSGSIKLRQKNTKGGCSDSTSFSVIVKTSPDARFTGDSLVCQGNVYHYAASAGVNETLLWNISGGEIQGGSSSNEIDVMWTDLGAQSIALIKTNSASGCVDSAGRNIVVNANPAAPVISESGGKLVSSADKGNQWYLDGVKIDGAMGKELLPKGKGNYTVKVNDDNGCESVMSEPYYYEPSDVQESPTAGIFFVSPNPASDYIEISSPSIKRGSGGVSDHITIYNTFGECVYSNPVPTDRGTPASGGQMRIDVSDLAPGMYFVKIGDKVSKFVKL